jgi:hypothetical protein
LETLRDLIILFGRGEQAKLRGLYMLKKPILAKKGDIFKGKKW